MLRLAVIGDPVEHSKSPELQHGFLDEAGIAGTYEAIRVAAGACASAVDALRRHGYAGLNVTTPLKEEAFLRAERCDPVALAARAVNVLLLRPECVEGHNTDGVGALAALREAGLGESHGARVLVLGTGPTARAVLVALAAGGAQSFVWSRTPALARANAMALEARIWRPTEPIEAAIATLPPGATLDPDLRAALLKTRIVIDANYGPRATLGAALGRGDVHDGLAMLRASSRASFELFRLLR
jgi:shikimate dehydrogenase